MSFKPFGAAVEKRFEELSSRGELFEVEMGKDELFDAYLNAFPEGTNLMYQKRTEHDCQCCKNFLRNLGHVVSINPETLGVESVWSNLGELPYPYDVVAKKLEEIVETKKIVSLFRSNEASYGKKESGGFFHFFGKVHKRHMKQRGDEVGSYSDSVRIFQKGLSYQPEIMDLLEDLLVSKAISLNEKFLASFKDLKGLREVYFGLRTKEQKDNFLWLNALVRGASLSNTVFGTLADDLTKGDGLDAAVGKYEYKVDPTNYNHSKSVVTEGMKRKALGVIKEHGLEASLKRRMAVEGDVPAKNCIWVDSYRAPSVNSSADDLEAALGSIPTRNSVPAKNFTDIAASDFLSQVLPKAKGLEVLLDTKAHGDSFCTLTAPQYPSAPSLFSWGKDDMGELGNEFGWAFIHGLTAKSKIKERVKEAGGKTGADVLLRASLVWGNGVNLGKDDLDIAADITYSNGKTSQIYFGNKEDKFGNRVLDVDANYQVTKLTFSPCENLSFVRLEDGEYRIKVWNYASRDKNLGTVSLELEYGDVVHQYKYLKEIQGNQVWIEMFTFKVENGVVKGLQVNKGLEGGCFGGSVWGLNPGDWVPVSSVMYSPNHWGGLNVGNRILMFMLRGCRNSDPVRGFFNEFLRSELREVRKVMEYLGNELQCEVAENQLSGLGFPMSDRAEVKVRVKEGRGYRHWNVKF